MGSELMADLTFLEFVAYCEMLRKPHSPRTPRSQWLLEPGIKLYVRCGWLPWHGHFVLANMAAKEPGAGALTRFLDQFEPLYQFSVENIINPRLIPYFKRRGYVYESGPDHWPTMLGPTR